MCKGTEQLDLEPEKELRSNNKLNSVQSCVHRQFILFLNIM